jgi:iron complex transport system substrate-binding protein
MKRQPVYFKLDELNAHDIELMNRITRRRFIGAGGVAIGAALAGCAAPPTREAAPTNPPATRRVKHAGGETEAPVNPQRIVALYTYAWAWPIAQLGVDVLATDARPEWLEEIRRLDPESAARLSKAEFIGSDSGPNLEKIAALKPDLIVGGWWNVDTYDKLSAIAPTVLLDYRDEADIIEWQRSLIDLIGATDTSRFDQRVAAYEQRIMELREAYPDVWPNLEYVRMDSFANDVYVVDTIPFMPGRKVFRDLGAGQSKTMGDTKAPIFDGPISLEKLPQFDADVIFVAGPNGEPKPEILAILQGTFAGKRDQVFKINPEDWNFANVESLHAILDEIERVLAGRTIDTSGDFR